MRKRPHVRLSQWFQHLDKRKSQFFSDFTQTLAASIGIKRAK